MTPIDNFWRNWFRMASTQLAMLAGLVGGWLAAHPDEAAEIVTWLRGYVGPFAPLVIGVFITGTASAARMFKFGKEQAQ